METYKMLGLNTAHVSLETAQRMRDDDMDVICYQKQSDHYHFGWFVPINCELIDKEENPDIPEDLRNVIRFGLEHGFDYLMFDECAEYIDELPMYVWNPVIKYRDPDGNVWESLQAYAVEYCGGKYCESCPLYHAAKPIHCRIWITDHKTEAARIMGLTIIKEEY